MARRMQKHMKNVKQQRKNAPKVNKLEGRAVNECPNCGSQHDQVPLSPVTNICMNCLKKYPRTIVMVV